MSLDALIRKEMIGVYLRDPAQSAELKSEAQERHRDYLASLERCGLLTPEIKADHERLVDGYYAGGWRGDWPHERQSIVASCDKILGTCDDIAATLRKLIALRGE